jgi:hypothetical protein
VVVLGHQQLTPVSRDNDYDYEEEKEFAMDLSITPTASKVEPVTRNETADDHDWTGSNSAFTLVSWTGLSHHVRH